MKTFDSYSSDYQIYNMVLLTVVTMMYITSSDTTFSYLEDYTFLPALPISPIQHPILWKITNLFSICFMFLL